jgi:hypothetical protein
MMKRLIFGVSAMVLASATVLGCSSDTKKSINEAVARNTVATAGTKQFHDSGHSLKGLLKCTTKSKTTTTVTVACTGTTDKNEPAALLGSTADATQIKGTFVGTVNGRQVFTTNCLGC